MAKAPTTFDEWYVKSSYQDFVRQEGVPLYQGSALEDLGALAEPDTTIEWEEGALFAIPLNAWHQEFNSSGDEPCRLLFGTNMAHVINLYRNVDFVFNNPFTFRDRYTHSMQAFFSDKGKHWNLRLYETNFIPDIRQFSLDPYPERGNRTSIMRLSMSNTSIGIHIMSVSEGTYVTAHRHEARAHVIVVGGQGYELLFMPDEDKNRRKVRTKPYAVVAPCHNEFHQHFNTGKREYRMLAFRGSGLRHGGGRRYDPARTAQDKNPYESSFKISYHKEDPAIREDYYRELEKNGITLRLEPIDQGG